MAVSRDDKVFSINEFWEGAPTHQIRLDEVNALRLRLVRGEEVHTGDGSAQDIVDMLFKRAGVTGHRLFEKLAPVFADALAKEVGDDPWGWVNPQYYSDARMTGANPVSVDGSFMVSGYPQSEGHGVKVETVSLPEPVAIDTADSAPVGAVDSEGQSEVMEAPSLPPTDDEIRARQIAELQRLIGEK
jgi:hypothetical protein